MGGFRRDGTRQAPVPVLPGAPWQETTVLAGRHDRHWPGAAEKGGWAAKGGTVHVGLIADCAFEPASPPLQFRIWLFSPLKLSMGKDHRLHLRVHSVDFQRPLLPRSFDNSIETRTPLVRPKKKSTGDSSRSSWFPKKRSNALGRFSAGQPLGLLGSTNLGRCIDLAV